MIIAFLKGPQKDLKSLRTDLREGLKNDKMSISTFGSIPPPKGKVQFKKKQAFTFFKVKLSQ